MHRVVAPLTILVAVACGSTSRDDDRGAGAAGPASASSGSPASGAGPSGTGGESASVSGGAGPVAGAGGCDKGGPGGGSAADDCRTTLECQESCSHASPNVECVFGQAPCFTQSDNFFPACDSDSDCGNGSSCFGCPQSKSVCVPSCATDAACFPGAVCLNQACIAATCTTTADCPANFACADGVCSPRPCLEDSECDGYCVGGFCTATLGACTF